MPLAFTQEDFLVCIIILNNYTVKDCFPPLGVLSVAYTWVYLVLFPTFGCTYNDFRLLSTPGCTYNDFRLLPTPGCTYNDFRLLSTPGCTYNDFRVVAHPWVYIQ